MKLYSRLSKISFLKNRYVAKFLFVAILGILIPVLILFYFIVYIKEYLAPLDLFLITIFVLFVGTVIMIVIFKSLLLPISKGANALTEYEITLKVPQLPTDYTDEMGVILRNVQRLIQTNQRLLDDKRELCNIMQSDLRNQTLETQVIVNAIAKKSADLEVKTLVSQAMQSICHQINFVDAYVEILAQEEIINKQPIKIRKVNVQELLDEVKLKRQAILDEKNIELSFKIKYPRIRLKVSNTLFLQALSYLIDNAIKHAPENSKIEVTTEKHRGKLILQVRDYGIGFDSRQAESIFSKFQPVQVEGNYAPIPGIYLTSHIIERFGSKIVAESDGLNQGARFIIELKLQR
jgi:K+-sensing histidine kinase KdpD